MEERVDDIPPALRLQIDENILDQEWQGHAEQAYNWSKYAAYCRFSLEDKKGELEAAQIDQKRRAAESEDEIRADPENYISGKPTETAIATAVVLHPKNKLQPEIWDAKKAISDAKYSLDVAEGAVDSLKDRKHALQSLVELHLSGYMGTPKERGGGEVSDHRSGRRGRRRVANDDA